MAPGWDPSAEAAQGAQGEKLPTGKHRVIITKVVVSKGTAPWKTKAGDRQIMVVFENEETAREASAFCPVEGKARWRLSKLVHAIGETTDTLKAKGLTDPTTLLIQQIADHYLKGRVLTIDVVLLDNGYHDVEFLEPEPDPQGLKAGSTTGKAAPHDDDIPF